MPYPNTTASMIVISQTSGSSLPGGQFPFVERQISGSNLFLVTDANGVLTGSTSIPGGSFTNLSVSGALTASIISASTALTSAAATFTGAVTMSSMLSASGGITASNINDTGTLTVIGTSTLSTTNVTGLLSASGNITASNIYDVGTLVVLGTTNLATLSASNISASSIQAGTATLTSITGVNTISGASLIVSANSVTSSTLYVTSNVVATNLTASNISASGTISASLFAGAHTGSTFGTASWATNALTAATANALNTSNNYTVAGLTANGNISASGTVTAGTVAIFGGNINNTAIGATTPSTGNFTALTASNISASGNISGSTGWFNNLTVAGTLNATVSGSITNANSASITANNSTATLQYITFVDGTGNRPLYVDQDSLTWQPSTNTLSSSGNFIGSNYTGSRMTATGGAGSSTAVGTQGILASNGIGANGNSYFSSDVGIGTTLTVGAAISSSNALWVGGNTTLAGNSATVTHTGTGNLTISSNNGSVLVESSTFTGNDVTIPGDIAVNGGDITTTAATFNLATANATTINIGGASATTIHSGLLDVTNTTAATIAGAGAIQTDGGVYIGKNLIVSGSTTLYGDVTMFGTGSIINISSSNIIIGDNRIQLNAWSVGGPQRYGGVDIFDSGSTAAVTSSILWDSLNNYWLLQTNQTGSGPIVTSSAIILQGPTSSFGSEFLLTVNNFLKVQTTTGNMITSSLSEVGNTLQYAGTISASVVTGSQVYGLTGSFINLNVFTGSAPGTGSQVPTSPTAAGLPGQIEVDNNFIYVYTNNIWKRVPVSVWSA